MLDSFESSNVDTITGLESVTAGDSFNSTEAFKIASATTSTVVFREPISISSDVLALDVTGIYRTEKFIITLLNGANELATSSVVLSNIDSTIETSLPYYSNESRETKHTLIFNFSDLTEDEKKYITAINITYNGSNSTKQAMFDNLRVINNTLSEKIDFEDLSNITNLTSLEIVEDSTVIDGKRSVKYSGNATNDNWMGIRFKQAVSISGKYIKFKVSGLGEDNTLSFMLMDSASKTKAIATASHKYFEYTETYGSSRVVDLYLEFTDLTDEEMSKIGGILIRHDSWTTNKITIDSIEFVDEIPTYPSYSDSVYSQEEFYLSSVMPYGYSNQYTGNYQTALDNLKSANMNLVEYVICEDNTKAITYAGEIGLDVIASTSFSGNADSKIPFNKTTLDWDLAARLELQKYASFENVIGYFVYDEPVSADFEFLTKINSFINKWDPARVAHSIILPSYHFYDPNTGETTTEGWKYSDYVSYVDNYINSTNPQILSFDYYPFMNGWNDVRECDWYKDLGLFRNRANANDLPFWYYISAVDANGSPLSTTKVSIQMNVALAYGASSVSVYGLGGYLYDSKTFEKVSDFEEKAAINKQVLNIGNLLYGKTATAIYHTGISGSKANEYYADNISDCTLLSSNMFENIELKYSKDAIISIFEDTDGKKFVMIVNKNLDADLSTSVKLNNFYSISQFDALNNTLNSLSNSTNTINISIAAGGAAVYVIE